MCRGGSGLICKESEGRFHKGGDIFSGPWRVSRISQGKGGMEWININQSQVPCTWPTVELAIPILLLFLVCRWGHWSSERLSDSNKATDLVIVSEVLNLSISGSALSSCLYEGEAGASGDVERHALGRSKRFAGQGQNLGQHSCLSVLNMIAWFPSTSGMIMSF